MGAHTVLAPQGAEVHYVAEAPASIPADYFGNWWEEVSRSVDAEGRRRVAWRSARTGRDAEYDAHVLIQRLASGLHFLFDMREEGA